ncbi:MAG: FprA family A-type flavoprotein [Ruminococcaceae bacterium]|nr:FprA family A-type flavoprotein [Oscillospiraceae bacterium]
MSVFKVCENIYSIGVLNPALRVFDIIMETKYGTSYNAYFVKGSEKCALIETVHATYFDEYLENIHSLTDVSKIDYLILNHTEPDHTGSIEKLLKLNPNIEVIATAPGIKYATSISNSNLNSRVVKDGDKIDLGGKTLEFTTAPFLHWPDSMFTYIPEDKTLFSCDMFGCHYCEPRMFDDKISNMDAYEYSLNFYYTAIFSPFKPHVLNGIAKVEKLEKDFVCTSHGPILTKHSIGRVIDLYKTWSKPQKRDKPTAAILYVSAYGYTRMLANKAYEICTANGFDAQICDIIKTEPSKVNALANESDVLLFGSPTINRDALKPVWDTISAIDAVNCVKKPAFVFGSYGWSGEGVPALCQRLSTLRFNVFGEGFKTNFKPSDDDIAAFEAMVTEFLKNSK